MANFNNEILKVLENANFAASQSSPAKQLNDDLAFSFHLIWSGATLANGSIVIEASNDGESFVPIEVIPLVNETDGGALINVERAGYNWTRARWEYSSGTGGLLTIWFCSKGA